ncbi:hypothetical protein LINGRAHAP2_LOCUS20390, partial [Linum grandiflorum]
FHRHSLSSPLYPLLLLRLLRLLLLHSSGHLLHLSVPTTATAAPAIAGLISILPLPPDSWRWRRLRAKHPPLQLLPPLSPTVTSAVARGHCLSDSSTPPYWERLRRKHARWSSSPARRR